MLELQRGSGRVLLIDDVVATGGTMAAAAQAVRRAAGFDVRGLARADRSATRRANFTGADMALRAVLRYD